MVGVIATIGPCPICGEPLRATAATVDRRDPDRPLGLECPSGHVASTPPHLFEQARMNRLLRDLQAWLSDRSREGLSEAELQAVAEAPGLLLLRTDRHRRITWASDSLSQAVGWTTQELAGRTVAEFLDPDYRAATETARDAFYERGETRGWYTFGWRTPDGGRRILSGLPIPVRDEEGQVAGSVSVLRDITTESEADGLLRGVLDSMLDPLVVLSPVFDASGSLSDLVYVAVNKAASTYLDLDAEVLVGGTLRGIFPSSAGDLVSTACEHVLMTGGSLQLLDQQFSDGREPEARYDLQITRVDACVAVTWRKVADLRPR